MAKSIIVLGGIRWLSKQACEYTCRIEIDFSLEIHQKQQQQQNTSLFPCGVEYTEAENPV